MDVCENSSTVRRSNLFILQKFFWIAALFYFQAQARTPANTLIENSVSVNYKVLSVPATAYSNVTQYRVDEILNFTLTSDNPGGVQVQTPDTGAVLAYTLTNQGNGQEKFDLSVSQSIADQFDPTVTKIFLDSNHNGTYDTGTDLEYSAGVNNPDLSPGDSVHVFLVNDVPASLVKDDEAHVSLVVSPATGSGPIGSDYPGGGDGGVDALMGSPGGNYGVENKLIVAAATASILKSQSILDPDGGNTVVPNSVITYTLTVSATGAGTLSNLNVLDLIPTGTEYVLHSIRLDSASLSDANDSDAGTFTGTEIQVRIPSVLAPATHTVSFKVRIL